MATPQKVEIDVWNLHVLVTHDEGGWFAQGAEVDYAAQGSSLDMVKKHFETGFAETINLHLKMYGTAKYFLSNSAPADVFGELLTANEKSGFTYSHKSIHILEGTEVKLEYAEQPEAQAA